MGLINGSSSPVMARVEQKFFVMPERQSLALALLRRVCRRDPLFPQDQINSLYFDTPELDQHERSDSGEFAKDKVRIRWYGVEHDPHRMSGHCLVPADPVVPVWLELKSRRGLASTKQRMKLEVSTAALGFPALWRGIVSAAVLVRVLGEFGFFSSVPLCPVIVISYRRWRFVEPETGFRVSLDTRIRSSVVMPGFGRGERGLELAGAVMEVKGPRFEIPRALRELVEIGSSWTRYSKYSASLDAHAAGPNAAARLWPAGILPRGEGVRDALLG